jgi:HEAT repeat protein
MFASSWMCRRSCAVLAALALIAAGGFDPVQDLKRALDQDDVTAPTPAILQFRRENLQQRIDNLKDVGELRRALALTEWRDELRGAGDPVRRIDAEIRRQVAQRLTKALEAQAVSKDANSRLAVANIIAEIGPSIRAVGDDKKAAGPGGDRGGFARSLTPLVQKLAADPDLGVRQEGLRALGTINPQPAVATLVFKHVLVSDAAVGPRRIAADSLGQLLRVMPYLYRPSGHSSGVEATAADAVEALEAVIETAPAGMNDPDPQVRHLCVEALRIAAQGLSDMNLINEPDDKKKFPPPGRPLSDKDISEIKKKYQDPAMPEVGVLPQVAQLRPTMAKLNAATESLLKALRDPDARVRLSAAEAFMHTAWSRQRLRQLVLSLPPLPTEKLDPQQILKGADPLETFLQKDVGALAPVFRDSDPRLRRAAAYTALLIEEHAQPLIHVLTANLVDPDRTVRWAAARTLSYLPPAKAAPAVGNLAKLMSDPDVQLRIAAAQALEGMGPLARDAAGALAEAALHGDTDGRKAALSALLAQGRDNARAAVPQLIRGLEQHDADPKALVALARTLGRLGRAAEPALPGLRRLIGHDDAEVRTSASEAILAINGAAD